LRRPLYANATYLPPTLETVVLYDLRHHRETKGHRNSHGPKGEPHGLAPLVGWANALVEIWFPNKRGRPTKAASLEIISD